jgi:hypothetical protein
LPAAFPVDFVNWSERDGQETNQKLCDRAVKIRTRRGDGHKRILVNPVR